MRSPRFPGVRRSARPGSTRFAGTFARRPDLPRIASLPDRRAWSTTAIVAGLVAATAFAVPLAVQLGKGKPDTTYGADAPVAFSTPNRSSDQSTTPTSGPTKTPTPPTTTVTVVRPGVTVVRPGVTVTRPAVTITQPGVTITGPVTTVTVSAPDQLPPGETKTGMPDQPVQNPPRAATTAGAKPAQPAAAPAGAAAPGIRVQNFDSNRCVDVKDAQTGVGKDGTPLQLWDCGQTSNQRWTFNSDGTVRSLGLCMDLAWASTAENTQVQLVNCNGGWAQKFTLNGAHELVNPTANKCVTADSTANGGRLVLRTCAGTSNQKWRSL